MRTWGLLLGLLTLVSAAPVKAQQPGPEGPIEGFRWKSALQQSGFFLGVMHGFRMATEEGSRHNLKGPFLKDYFTSVKGVGGWGDGDPFLVNYVGHPFQGSVEGFIYIHNDPGSRRVEFGRARLYWESRLRAMGYAALMSTQWEIGPVSEASIGNIGLQPGTAGAVDFVVTPVAGFGVMLAEDALDRFLIRRIERWSTQPVIRILVRGFLNPTRTFANAMRFKRPWERENRPGVTIP